MKASTKLLIVALVFLLVVIIIVAAANTTVKPGDTSKSQSTTPGGNDPSNTTPTNNSDHGSGSTENGTTFAATNATVYFIDVGQGDAELIRTADNKSILIDTGPSGGRSALISFLSSYTYGVIDDLVLTHPDADHIGNAVAVLSSFEVKAVYQSGCHSSSATYSNLQSTLSNMSMPQYTDAQVDIGDMMNWSSSVTFQIMAINAQASETNDASIVLKMTDGKVSFLFEGDASSSVESQMDSQFGSAMDVDILKVGHHGSSSDSSASFLSMTSPAVAVIEVAADNSYNLPTQQTLDRLAAAGSQVYRTDQDGTVTITTDGSAWTVHTAH